LLVLFHFAHYVLEKRGNDQNVPLRLKPAYTTLFIALLLAIEYCKPSRGTGMRCVGPTCFPCAI